MVNEEHEKSDDTGGSEVNEDSIDSVTEAAAATVSLVPALESRADLRVLVLFILMGVGVG